MVRTKTEIGRVDDTHLSTVISRNKCGVMTAVRT
jgi:hypothetical protein